MVNPSLGFNIGANSPISNIPGVGGLSLLNIAGASNPGAGLIAKQELLKNKYQALIAQHGPEEAKVRMRAALTKVLQSGKFNASDLVSLGASSPIGADITATGGREPLATTPSNLAAPTAGPAQLAGSLNSLLDTLKNLSTVPPKSTVSIGGVDFNLVNRNGNVVLAHNASKNAFSISNDGQTGLLSIKQLFKDGQQTPNAKPLGLAGFSSWILGFIFKTMGLDLTTLPKVQELLTLEETPNTAVTEVPPEALPPADPAAATDATTAADATATAPPAETDTRSEHEKQQDRFRKDAAKKEAARKEAEATGNGGEATKADETPSNQNDGAGGATPQNKTVTTPTADTGGSGTPDPKKAEERKRQTLKEVRMEQGGFL